MRFLALLFALIVMTLNLSAQEDEYRLRVPSAEEFMLFIPEIVEQYSQEQSDNFHLLLILYYELFERYPNFSEQSFETLYAVSNVFHNYTSIQGFFGDEITQSDWNDWVITAWLQANPNILNSANHLEFGNFQLDITRADLSGDGIEELLIKIVAFHPEYSNLTRYIHYWVLQEDEMKPLLYHRIYTPLKSYPGSGYDGALQRAGNILTYQIEDINDDGLLEWVVLQGRYNFSGFAECRQLWVLAWRDNGLANLMDDELHYCTSNHSMLEETSPNAFYQFTSGLIIQLHNTYDSWGCQWREITRFKWNGVQYTGYDKQSLFEESFECAMREAELALWSGDIVSATWYYEQAFALPEKTNVETDTWTRELVQEQRQYALTRLAIAYVLIDETDKAVEIFNVLKSENPDSDMMRSFITSTVRAFENGNDVCEAAYKVFEQYQESSFDYSDIPIKLLVGMVTDHFSMPFVRYPPPDPALAGCTYIKHQPIQAIPTPSLEPIVETVEPNIVDLEANLGGFRCGFTGTEFCAFFRSTTYSDALKMTENALADGNYPVGVPEDFEAALKYRRALALEQLDRTDEALAEYVAIYEAAPESAWGMLARLHFE